MKERERVDFITQNFVRSGGSHDGVRVYTITNVHDGDTEVVIETSQSARYPVKYLNDVLLFADDLRAGGGRRVVSVDDIHWLATHRGEIQPKVKPILKVK